MKEPQFQIESPVPLEFAGRSQDAIAKLLCNEGVEPPRAHTRHRRKGWVHSSIRAMLYNEKYVGIWKYKEREWVKVPGENRRLPRQRDPKDVMIQHRPQLRIIDDETWKAVQARLKRVRETFTRNADGTPKGRAISGRQNNYVLSGLLFCGTCGGPMVINGGTSARYYRCADHKRRGTCKNDLCVKESIARQCVLAAIRDRLTCPEGIARARKRLAEKLGELSRTSTVELHQRKQRLARTETRIKSLLEFIADKNEHSDYVWTTVRDLEAQAKTEKSAIAELERNEMLPIRLPTLEEVAELAFSLERRSARDPVACREWLRRILKGEKLVLEPTTERFYVARGDLLPFMLLAETEKEKRRQGVSEPALPTIRSGGEI